MKKSILVILVAAAMVSCAQNSNGIFRNQSGYYPGASKIMVLTGEFPSAQFQLLDEKTNAVVYTGTLEKAMPAKYSSQQTYIADFSSFTKPGRYKIVANKKSTPHSFLIKEKIHHAVAVASLKGYYYQRVSMPLEKTYAGKWARPAGHPDTQVLIHPSAASAQRPAGTVISCPGGWYDAGDYNKYIVNSGITMGTLLAACEDFPQYFDTLNTHIPESGDNLPDILNEIVYNLRWMLTMQDPFDGGVYNKCTNADFDGMVMPGVTTLPRYAVQKGTAATLDFAAVTAQAARILRSYQKQLPGLADSCEQAAGNAWQWALQHPAMAYNQTANNNKYEPKITTGGYGDRTFTDEWFWAACELFITTKKKNYSDAIQSRWKDAVELPSWGNVGLLGYYSLLRHRSIISEKTGIDMEQAKQKLVQFAEHMIYNGGDKAYRTIMGQSNMDFIWGSSAVAMNQSIVMINAYMVTKEKKYIACALSNLDYVLGRNATGYCFVTGIGYQSPKNPHHRPSVADGVTEPVPGLLAGGPNPWQQDGCAGYPSKMPAESYVDNSCSYASNEIAINWNAPLVYVANALEALQYIIGYAE